MQKMTKEELLNKYDSCDCGSIKTYMSVAGDLCCAPCFKRLKRKALKQVNEIRIYPDSGGWSVRVGDVVKKYFSKYEDYAFTEVKDCANKLNKLGNK